MSGGFVKIYGTRLLNSTLWLECWQARLLFISMLSLADKEGVVDIPSIPVLAHAVNLKVKDVEIGLAVLEAVDGSSRTPDEGGRRVIRDEVGWVVVNYELYREMRTKDQEQARQRVAKWREKNKSAADGAVPEPPKAKPDKAPIEASPDAIGAAQYLYDAIRTHRPDFKDGLSPAALEKKLMGWAKNIDVGMRRDGMTVDGCKEAVDAAHRSLKDFWRPNVLGGNKLRKHYEALRTKWASENKAAKDPNVFRPGEVDYAAFGEMMNLGKTT